MPIVCTDKVTTYIYQVKVINKFKHGPAAKLRYLNGYFMVVQQHEWLVVGLNHPEQLKFCNPRCSLKAATSSASWRPSCSAG